VIVSDALVGSTVAWRAAGPVSGSEAEQCEEREGGLLTVVD
jgi:hypothetical protein